MKGTVTIHADGKKIYEDTNVLTDAGGEVLAEAMTVSPSLSGIASASSILDASNYTIQAISFGKSADSYAALSTNAHLMYANIKHYACVRTGAAKNDNAVTPHVVLAVQASDTGSSATFVPTSLLSNEPSPTDTRLERGSTAVSGTDPYSALIDSVWNPADLSASIHNQGDMGQNINVSPSAYAYAQASVHDSLWSQRSSSEQKQIQNFLRAHYGCWADSSGSLGVVDFRDPDKRHGSFAYVLSSYDDMVTGEMPVEIVAASTVYAGYFNSASSMDTSGYVTMISTGVGDTTGNSVSGLIIEPSDTTFSSTGRIKYQVTIGSGDVGCANMYGGVYTMGLWCLDVPATIQDGGVAPFAWGPVASKRKYKLFSKKGFNKNICHHSDYDPGGNAGMQNPKDLLISWTIDFFGPTI